MIRERTFPTMYNGVAILKYRAEHEEEESGFYIRYPNGDEELLGEVYPPMEDITEKVNAYLEVNDHVDRRYM